MHRLAIAIALIVVPTVGKCENDYAGPPLTMRTASASDEQKTKGRQTLLDAQTAYRALKSYRGRIAVGIHARDAEKWSGDVNQTYTVEAIIGTSLKLDGTALFDEGPVGLVVDKSNAVIFILGKREKMPSPLAALEGLAGPTYRASRFLPSILSGLQFKSKSKETKDHSLLQVLADVARLDKETPLDGRACDRIECVFDEDFLVLYVDKKTHLLRRVLEVERQDTKGNQSVFQHDFLIDGTDETLSPERFRVD